MKLHNQIFLGIALGIAWGFVAQSAFDGEIYIGFLGIIFKQCLMMLIAPLVFASIVMGVCSIGDPKQLGKMGYRTLVYYFSTTFLAVIVGLILVNVVRPGDGADVDKLQVRLEIARGVPKKVFRAARRAFEQGEGEEAYFLYSRYMDRYPDQPEAGDAELELERVQEEFSEIFDDENRHELLRKEKLVEQVFEELRGLKAPQATVSEFFDAQISKALKNPFQALAQTEVLAIIVFALLLGVAITSLGEMGRPLVGFFDSLNHSMMLITEWVMRIAPVGVAALMAEAVATMGVEVLRLLAWYMMTVVVGLAIHGLVVLPAILLIFGRMKLTDFLDGMKPALAIAFSTSSSSATLPVTMECAHENLGVSERVVGFVLPLGATVNMDGTALYESVAAIFIAQMFGIELSAMQQILVFVTATLAAVGAAGIPSAGTVTMAMVLTAVNLPLEGIGMILAVDRLLDMLRTTVNVIGDGMGTVIIERLEQSD